MNLGQSAKYMTLAFVLAGTVTAIAGDWALSRQGIGGGGMHSAGGDFELSGTVGQAYVGLLTGGDFTVAGGFWFPVAPGDCDEDGLVGLLDHTALAACLTGPAKANIDPPDRTCSCFDVDRNGTVDLADIRRIQTEFTGP